VTDYAGPTFSVTVLDDGGNEELLQPEDVRVLQLQYADKERSADVLSLTVDNFDLAHFDNPVWKQGNRIRVTWGYPGRMAPARICVIRKVTGFSQLKVEAHGLEVVFNRITRSRTFENMTVHEVISQIARENGYGDDAVDIQETTGAREHIVQANMTDYQFIRRLAHQVNYEFFLDWDGLHFHERRLEQRSHKTVTWYREQARSEILSINVKTDVTALPARTRVRSRNPLDRNTNDEASDNNSDSGRGTTGIRLVAADAEEARLTGQVLVAQEQQTPGQAATPEEAAAEAQARRRRAQQRAVQMTMTIIGDPLVLAKAIIRVEGIGQRLSGNYYVKDATHTIGSDYRTALTLVKDATGSYARRAARSTGLPEVAAARSRGNTSSEEQEEGQPPNSREAVRFQRASGESATLTGETVEVGGEESGERRSRNVMRHGRDSRTRGGQPAPPASAEAAEASTRD
jgi:phage protein D